MYLKTIFNGLNDPSTLREMSHGELMFEIWHRRNLAPELRLMSELDIGKRKMFPSFTIGRNPLHRLVSAWREKLGPLTDGDVLFNKVKYYVVFSSFFGQTLLLKFIFFQLETTWNSDYQESTAGGRWKWSWISQL